MPLGHMVNYSADGLVTLTWTMPPRINDPTIQWFVRGLADDVDACVMNQLREIWYPSQSKLEFERNKESIGRRFEQWRATRRQD